MALFQIQEIIDTMGCGKSQISDVIYNEKHPDLMRTTMHVHGGLPRNGLCTPICDPTVQGYDLDRFHCALLIRDYELRTDISQTLKDYVQFLQWWLDRYKDHDPGEKPVVRISDDPNKNPFPVPGYVLKDPLILRSWICEWKPMDTDIVGVVAWSHAHDDVLFYKSEDNEDGTCNLVRDTELDDELPEFDFNIDGDVAWDELPCDVIKEDITTEDQDRIIIQRGRRADLNDVDTMKKRHSLLLNYFRDKYQMGNSVVEQFSGFVDRVVQNNEHFELLCQER